MDLQPDRRLSDGKLDFQAMGLPAQQVRAILNELHAHCLVHRQVARGADNATLRARLAWAAPRLPCRLLERKPSNPARSPAS